MNHFAQFVIWFIIYPLAVMFITVIVGIFLFAISIVAALGLYLTCLYKTFEWLIDDFLAWWRRVWTRL